MLKIFDENSMEKLNFYYLFIFILENLLLKLEPSEIEPLFYSNFIGFGRNFHPFPAMATPLMSAHIWKAWTWTIELDYSEIRFK